MPASSNKGGRPQGRSSTHQGTKGQSIVLTKAVDKGYLCSKICLCKNTMLRDSLGRALKQRCTTKSIWTDEDANQLVWGYKAEVGYSMKTNPPAPLMSRTQPNRPTRFPLGKAQEEGLLKRTLEGRPQKGLLRIPDCIVLKVTGQELAAMRAAGHIEWRRLIPVQSNIETVIEIKFEGDRLKPEQLTAYRRIAGRPDKFRMIEQFECDCDRRRPPPATEPVRVPVTTPMEIEIGSKRAWYQSSTPTRILVPAPQPVKPQYGPILLKEQGTPIAEYLKGAAVVAGVILVGVVAIAAIPAELAASAAGGLVLLLVGTRTAASAPVKKKEK